MTSNNDERLEEAQTLEEIVGRVEGLLDQIESYSDPTVRRMVFELLDLIDAMHREALTRLAGGLNSVGFLEKAVDDPFVAHLFSVYGLLGEDQDPEAVVQEALAEILPYVHSHGGEIEVVDIDRGIVTVRMLGSCAGCPSSVVTLTQSFEKALRSRWPSLIRIEVENEQDDRWQSVTIRPAR